MGVVSVRAGIVNYSIQYLFDKDDPRTECWSFVSLLPGLEGAKTLAREGLQDVREHFGATGFKIFDAAGDLVSEEFVLSSAPGLHLVA